MFRLHVNFQGCIQTNPERNTSTSNNNPGRVKSLHFRNVKQRRCHQQKITRTMNHGPNKRRWWTKFWIQSFSHVTKSYDTKSPWWLQLSKKQTKDQILAWQTNPFQQPWVSGTLHAIPTWERVKQRWVGTVLGSPLLRCFFLDPHPKRIIWATRPYFKSYWFFNRDPYNGSTTIPT